MGRDLGRLVDSTKKVAEANAEAFGIKQGKAVDRLTNKIEDQQVALNKSRRNLEGLLRQYDAIKNADVVPASLKRMESELAKTQRDVKKTADEFAKLEEQYLKVLEQAKFEEMAGGAVTPETTAELKRLESELDPISNKLEDAKEKSEQLQSTIEKIKLDPAQSEEAQKLADKIKTAEEAYKRLAEKTHDTADEVANIVTNAEGFATPFERALISIEKESAAIADRIREQQREYEALLRLYEKAETALESAKESGNQAAIELAQSNMDRLLNDIDKVKDGNEDLAYQAAKLKEQLNELALYPENTNEAEEFGSQIADIAENLNKSVSSAKQFNSEIHDAFDFGDESAKATGAFGRVKNVLVSIQGAVNKIYVGLRKIVAVPAFIARGLQRAIRAFRNFTSHIFKANKATGGLNKSFGTLFQRITRLATAALVFNIIRRQLRNLSDYLGAVMRTNQQFINSLASVKGNLLTAFQPIWEAILPALNALGAALARVTGYLAAFVNFLFGKSASASQDAAKSLYNQAKALDATGKAADKASGALAAFDEINVLTQQNAEDAAGVGTDIIEPDFDYDLSWFEDLFNQFDSLPEAFYELGKRVAESINNFLEGIDWDKVQENARLAAESIASLLNGFVENLDWTLLGSTIGQGINTAIIFAETFIATFNWQALASGLAAGLNSMVNTIDWEALGRTFYKGLNAITGAIYTFFDEVDWTNLGISIVTALNTAISGIDWDLLGRSFAVKWRALVDTIHAIVTGVDWSGLGSGIAVSVNGWFDEINWDESGETVAIGLNGIATTILNFFTETDWDKIGSDLTSGINTAIASTDWALLGDAIASPFQALIDLLYPIVTNFDWRGIGSGIGESLNNAIAGIDWRKATETLSKSIIGVMNTISEAIQTVNWQDVGKAIADALAGIDYSGITEAFWELIGSAIGAAVQLLWTVIKEAVDSIGAFFEEQIELAGGNVAAGLLRGILVGLGNVFNWIKEKVVDPIVNGFKKAFGIHSPSTVMAELGAFLIEGLAQGIKSVIDSIIEIFTELWDTIKSLTAAAWEKITEIWDVASGWFSENVITPISTFFSDFWENIKQFASDAWDGIKRIWEVVSDWFNSTIIEPVSEFFSGLWESISSFASDSLENIKSAWETIIGWFNDKIITPLNGAFKGFVNGVLSMFENLGNGIINAFEGAVNFIINAVNSLISKVNSISSNIPFGDKLSIPTIPNISLGRISIPKLATGAVIPPNSEFLAILGDQKSGRNIEAPEGLIRGLIRDEVSDILSDLVDAMSGGSSTSQPIILQIDGDTILTAVIEAQKQAGKRNDQRKKFSNDIKKPASIGGLLANCQV